MWGVVTASQPTNAASKIEKEDGTPTGTAASYLNGMTHKDMGETDRQMAGPGGGAVRGEDLNYGKKLK